MNRWHDLLDWVGGWPFEVAAPDAIFAYLKARDFTLQHLKTCGGGLGCNQFVFVRTSDVTGGRDAQ
jgi:2-polyprenyl-6-hydroxyphenyl methylase/3-demethylubiquinone-9 3-methyltransferase